MKCLRCETDMNYMKEYKFDSQDNNRGLFNAVFDVEERLIFDIYVCPTCNRSEFFYKGTQNALDMD